MAALAHADALIDNILREADLNQDGKISWPEFLHFVEATEQQLWSLFVSIDRNADGMLDENEMNAAFRKAGIDVPDERMRVFFAKMDRNNDKVIEFEEWRDFLLFLPAEADKVALKEVYSYFCTTMKLSADGDGRYFYRVIC